jgi:hypothetical protein
MNLRPFLFASVVTLGAALGAVLFLAPAPVAQERPLTGVAGVWIRDLERGTLQDKLADVRALGVASVSVAERHAMLVGRRLEPGERLIRAARDAGLKVWLHPHEYERADLEGTPLTQYEAGGRAWGELACRYPETVAGFVPQNEWNFPIRRSERGGQADVVARLHADVMRAFARGVKDACPGATVIVGPVGRPEEAEQVAHAARLLRLIAPDLRAGLFDGIAVNYYATCRAFEDDGEGGLRLRRPISDVLDDLLRAADLPLDTRVDFPETNVSRPSCRSEEARARALAALLREESADDRVGAIRLYSPWPQSERSANDFTIRPGTPSGEAVSEWARDAGTSSTETEEAWYCRWFGVGCS